MTNRSELFTEMTQAYQRYMAEQGSALIEDAAQTAEQLQQLGCNKDLALLQASLIIANNAAIATLSVLAEKLATKS